MKWFKKRRADTESINVDAAVEKAVTAKIRLSLTSSLAEARARYLDERKGKNGFGEDFEFTMNPRTEGNS